MTTVDLRPAGSGVIDHGALQGLADDDHLQYLQLAGRAGGQTALGSPNAGDDLTLAGNLAALDGAVVMANPVNSDINPSTFTGGLAAYNHTPVYTGGAGLNTSFNSSPNITVTSAISIVEAMRGVPIITQEAATAFSAFTLFQALPIVRTVNGAFNPMQALVLNAGPTCEVAGAITPPACPQLAGMSFAPQTRATTSGGTASVTAINGVRVAPTFSTVAGSVANLGTITGMDFAQPAVALFQPQAGTELMTAYRGMNFPNMTFGGAAATYIVINSQLLAGTNKLFLNHTGTARSVHNGDFNIEADITGIQLGIDNDVRLFWAGNLAFQFNSAGGASGFDDQFRISNTAADRFEISAALAASELSFVFNKGSFGEGGAAGNNKWRFVAQAETVTIGSEFSQFILTQAANDTIDAALSAYAGWTINAPTPTIGTGSLTTAVGLNVGGNPGAATVNRVGVRIISNPSGGSGVNAALWVTAGLSQLDGDLEHGGTNLGFYGTAPIAQPSVTGSRAGNAALASLLTQLANLGLIVDNTVV